jgi:hypothetical protein
MVDQAVVVAEQTATTTHKQVQLVEQGVCLEVAALADLVFLPQETAEVVQMALFSLAILLQRLVAATSS